MTIQATNEHGHDMTSEKFTKGACSTTAGHGTTASGHAYGLVEQDEGWKST